MSAGIVATEPLTTGWEPDVPVHDTVHRQFVFNSADRVGHHARAMGGTVHVDDDLCAGDLGSTSALGNQAILLRPMTEASAPDVTERLRGAFSGPHVLFSAWRLRAAQLPSNQPLHTVGGGVARSPRCV
jgi:hypothetical protein